MELTRVEGTIYKIFDAQNKGKSEDKPFWIREFVIYEQDGKFDNYHKLQMTGKDNMTELDKFNELDEVVCDIAINGRKWQNTRLEEVFFTTLKCINLAHNLTKKDQPFETIAESNSLDSQKDDLPF